MPVIVLYHSQGGSNPSLGSAVSCLFSNFLNRRCRGDRLWGQRHDIKKNFEKVGMEYEQNFGPNRRTGCALLGHKNPLRGSFYKKKSQQLWTTHHQHILLQRSLTLDHNSHQNPSWKYLKSKLIWLSYMHLPNSRTRWRDFKKGWSHKCQWISREDGLGS